LSIEQRMQMIEKSNPKISIAEQCEMVNIPRSSYYEHIKEKSATDQQIKEIISAIYTDNPSYGSRRITAMIKRRGISINRKKTQRLMQEMELQGIHPKRRLSVANREHKKYPYIARDKEITRINQVWSADITYIKTSFGTVYLVAIIDWYSRLILSSEMSNTMGEEFCIAALNKALQKGVPDIFNTDQGSQFTGNAFISIILEYGIMPSMDGKGRATDNAPSERFWRSVKWEEVYLFEPKTFLELQQAISRYIKFYNHERPHQSLQYKTPSEAHLDLEKKPIDVNYRFIYTEKELQHIATTVW
jgi:putative transposase